MTNNLFHPSFLRKIALTIVPSVVAPLLLALFLSYAVTDLAWVHIPFHSLIEAAGSFAAIILAVFIIIMRKSRQLSPYYIWVGSSLIGMGILDGFHASIHTGNTFVWLHSVAVFFGGILFTLVPLPHKFYKKKVIRKLPPYIALALALALGISSVADSSWIPQMTVNGEFTLTAVILNLSGSLGFFVAGVYFFAKHKVKTSYLNERLILANHCFLFGTAGLLFELSTLWDATWWLWHILRFAAYIVLLWFFISVYYRHNIHIQKSEEQFRSLVTNMPGIIYRSNANEHADMLYMSPPTKSITGFKASDFVNKIHNFAGIIHKDDVRQVQRVRSKALKEKHPFQLEYRILDQNGQMHFVSERGVVVDDTNGKPKYVDGTIFDISERKKYEKELILFKKAFDTASDAIFIADRHLQITNINHSYEVITGFSKNQVLGKTLDILWRTAKGETHLAILKSLRTHGNWSGETLGKRKNGKLYPKRLTVNKIIGEKDEDNYYVGIFQDITEQKQTESKLENLAFYDQLTQIPNRAAFNKRLEHSIEDARRHSKMLAVMLIDLDKFKYVNDTLGHAVGDTLLKAIAHRLKNHIRLNDTIARLGGDEFIIVATDLTHPEQVTPVVKNIISDLEKPVTIEGHEIQIGGSLGISIYPNDGNTVSQLTLCADMAMYEAKESSKERYCFFSSKLQERVLHFIQAESDLRKGIERNEFVLFYQPKFSIADGRLSGAEALARWRQPEKGIILPDKFIPIAEETALIDLIGKQLFREACLQNSIWNKDTSKKRLKIAINLSAKQFLDKNLITYIKSILDESNMLPENLEIEITESVIMQDVESCIIKMRTLKSLGISLAVDDFGTGYSSLSYLKRFPIDTLKIDKSFVRDVTESTGDAAIVKAVINLANSMKLDVVAEGVESKKQLQFLKKLGCQMAQGYLLGRPMPKDIFEASFISNRATETAPELH